MAKFAKCGYGSRGQGLGKTADGYTYVVNDNVRTGQKIQVIATSRRNRKFPTTAVPLHTFSENSAKGQEAKQKAQEATGREPTRSYTGKELGAKGSKDIPAQPNVSPARHDVLKPQSEYVQAVRAGNVAKYLEANPNSELSLNARETFDSYSAKFMPKGENK